MWQWSFESVPEISLPPWIYINNNDPPQRPHSLRLYKRFLKFFLYTLLVGHSFAYVAYFVFLRDV